MGATRTKRIEEAVPRAGVEDVLSDHPSAQQKRTPPAGPATLQDAAAVARLLVDLLQQFNAAPRSAQMHQLEEIASTLGPIRDALVRLHDHPLLEQEPMKLGALRTLNPCIARLRSAFLDVWSQCGMSWWDQRGQASWLMGTPHVSTANVDRLAAAARGMAEYADALEAGTGTTGATAEQRLKFDTLTQTVTLDGEAFTNLDPVAFRILRVIWEGQERKTSSRELTDLPGLGSKNIPRELKKLPEELQAIVRGATGAGRWICLPPRNSR
jgi:hypothetical protein